MLGEPLTVWVYNKLRTGSSSGPHTTLHLYPGDEPVWYVFLLHFIVHVRIQELLKTIPQSIDVLTVNGNEPNSLCIPDDIGFKPLIHQSELRTKVVSFKEKSSFRFVVL